MSSRRVGTRSRSRSRSRIAGSALAAGATAVGLLALTACGSDDGGGGGDGAGGDRLDVVASFYPMEFLAERIGGDHVSVSTLTEPGVEPHDLELSPRQTARVSDADLVVYLAGLQPTVDDAVETAGVEHVAEATSFTTLEEHGDDVDGHGDEHGDEHAEEGHEGHDHDHEGGDPHIWLDPAKYAEVAQGVGDALADADPDHAADYARNTETLVAELHALDDEFATGLEGRTSDTFITTHAAFGYLAEAYGLHEEAITGIDPESEPSGARMRDLQEIAEADGVTTVFFETLVSDDTARTLADDLGLRTAVLDPVEGITDESPGADYLSVMRANLAALQEALGVPAA
ncbi:metal ABC transporter substrate-binding protein [Streptomyces sp. NPDC049879]|uniref:metal ABC transporter substrate-binding protein n=1 Tax=Streptomyces sp. NPDC049879 TaxID=3365598 RepID=UPI0037941190